MQLSRHTGWHHSLTRHLQPTRQLVCARAAAARPARWMKVVEAHEYSFFFGYTNGAPPTSAAAAAATGAAGSQQAAASAVGLSQAAASAVGLSQAAAADQTALLTQQQLAQEISSAADWPDLLQLATEHRQQLPATLWLRLMFRLFVTLYEVEWQAADLQQLLTDELPPLLSATAEKLRELNLHTQSQLDSDPQQQQQQQQQQMVGHLADMLYALAVLATASSAADADASAAAARTGGNNIAATSSTSADSSSCAGGWCRCAGMQQLLGAVADLGASWDMSGMSRKDAVSLLWAFGTLLQLQQQQAASPPDGTNHSSSTPAAASPARGVRFVSKLCSHLALLIQLSNNTADPAAAPTPLNPSQAQLLNPGSSSLSEPWHPEDLTDAVTGLAAAAGFRGEQNPSGFSSRKAYDSSGFKSQAAAELLDAAAHEVYRQLSNRHSTAGSFTAEGVVALLQAYCDLNYQDGPSLRMFDAAAGWVVKRVRARHMQAPSSPAQLAAVAGVFARLQHRSVVVPELLNALGVQACKAAASAVELAAAEPWAYHASSSSSYCHWLPQHAAALLQAHLQLGYRPTRLVLTSVLTAVMLHWEHKGVALVQQGGELLQQNAAGAEAASSVNNTQPQQQQKQRQEEGQQAAVADDLQQQVAAVELLEVLAQLGHDPGDRVLDTIMRQAWANSPHEHLSHRKLLTLLFSSAQLAASSTLPDLQTMPAAAAVAAPASTAPTPAAIAAVADELILSAMPEHQAQQQQQDQGLDLPGAIRVLWSLCAYGCLDIAQYGWLLVAVAGGPWQRLSPEQLLVIKQGQLLLGEDGTDMATEVLPAQLLKRVEAAWEKHSQQQPAPSAAATAAAAGPHVCLGMGLFMAEAKVLLALLARKYDVTLADQAADVHFKVSFFSQLTQGSVKFSKRQQLAAAV